jgi:hypothetical protein
MPTVDSPGESMGVSEDFLDRDMLVCSARTGWVIGQAVSDTIMSVQGDHDRWHDVNKAVVRWLEGFDPVYRSAVVSFFMGMKGEPIDRWHPKYHGLPTPQWDALIEVFRGMGLLEHTVEDETL